MADMRNVVDVPESESLATAAAAPNTLVVLLLLVAAAATFSYLGAYAGTGALVEADVLANWPPDQDPRPRWMAIGFATLLGLFLFVGGALRLLIRHQLRRIDAIGAED